jgi:predicted transcriptional regulator
VVDTTKRDHVEIIAEILELCTKPTVKTQIIYKLNLSYDKAQKCINQLLKLELLKLEEDHKKYVTTEKGLEFIGKYEKLQELLRS